VGVGCRSFRRLRGRKAGIRTCHPAIAERRGTMVILRRREGGILERRSSEEVSWGRYQMQGVKEGEGSLRLGRNRGGAERRGKSPEKSLKTRGGSRSKGKKESGFVSVLEKRGGRGRRLDTSDQGVKKKKGEKGW